MNYNGRSFPLRTYTLLSLALLLFAGVYAQGFKNSSDSGRASTNSGSTEKKTYPPGSAWTLSWPLGTHIESTLDTLLYNYQRQFVESMRSDAWATTGQFTGPAINMIYFDRDPERPFYFNNALSYWLPSFAKQKFYNVYIPYTKLSYGMGYGTEERTDHLQMEFAGNVNRRIGVGAWLDYPYTKGAYANQAAKGLGWGFSGYYAGNHYDMQAFFNHANHVNKENGGITDDLYIINPAELQGGVSSIEPKSIPVNLSAAHNRLTGSEFYMSHAYRLGTWKDVTAENDTVTKEVFVPHTQFIYSFDWKKDRHTFLNQSTADATKFWENTYFDKSGTRNDDTWMSVANTFGIEMVEGFQKWAKFGLMAYVTYEYDRYRYAVQGMDAYLNPSEETGTLPDGETSAEAGESAVSALPEGWASHLSGSRNRLWVGGRIEKTKGSIIRYAADAKFGLIGDAVGDVDVSGRLDTRFRLAKDTVRISVGGFFKNVEPNYMLNHYVGNHFIWNNNFGKTRNFRVEGKLLIPWTRTELKVGFENIQNHIYFNSACVPAQYGGNIQVFSAAIDQKLKLGIFNWNNTVTYQKTSNMDILPLPELAVYSNMFLNFKAFKALTVQVGFDVDWYTSYKGYAYQPATMTFHQQGENAVKVGNFINSDVYLTCKLYKTRFFLMCSHLTQGWFNNRYFSLPHYPIDPIQFRLGLSIDFAN